MPEFWAACKNNFDYPKIQDSGISLEINAYKVELNRSRLDEMKTVMGSISEVRSDLESLKMEVLNCQENRTDYLRKKMYNMEEKMMHLKESIKEELLNLLRDEINLCRDLKFTERRIEEWGKPLNMEIFRPIKQSSCKVWRTNDNAAAQLLKFLSTSGGRYGGWEEQDHLLFLKQRKKFKGKDKFLSTVQCLLPDLSFDQIEEHEKWYQKYEDLRNFQREAIQKWRTEKESREKKEKEKTKVAGERREMRKLVSQQINISERIKEWKKQKLLRKEEEVERQKREKERMKEEEKKRAEMHEMKKQAVNKYKAEKLRKAQESVKRENGEFLTREAKIRNSFLLKSFRLQDLQFIEKKKIIRFQIETKANEKTERWRLAKPALEIILQRNPQRIFQPTLIWNQHCLEAQKREKINPVFDLNSIPRLKAVRNYNKQVSTVETSDLQQLLHQVDRVSNKEDQIHDGQQEWGPGNPVHKRQRVNRVAGQKYLTGRMSGRKSRPESNKPQVEMKGFSHRNLSVKTRTRILNDSKKC